LSLGNSVVAMGALSSLGAGLSTLGGGEVSQVTELVQAGRRNAIARMVQEAKQSGGSGLTGVSFEMINHVNNLEFVAQGSAVHDDRAAADTFYSTAANAQELYCQLDAGFAPRSFVFGNIAYSIGLGGSVKGSLRRLSPGEVQEYTDIFDITRHKALARIVDEARGCGANAVLGIRTQISALLGTQEMTMLGTASYHPALAGFADAPVTSDLTAEEMWNVCHLGMTPVQLVMGVSVYSLGLARNIQAVLRSFVRGEVGPLTELLYDARDTSLARVEREAERLGADTVLGVKLRVYDLGSGLVEVMALGTAVKKIAGMGTRANALFPQALVPERATFVDSTASRTTSLTEVKAASARTTQMGPARLIWAAIMLMVLFFRMRGVFTH
jgi:uncharacterized protein YbjQ (UPF0145 family)